MIRPAAVLCGLLCGSLGLACQTGSANRTPDAVQLERPLQEGLRPTPGAFVRQINFQSQDAFAQICTHANGGECTPVRWPGARTAIRPDTVQLSGALADRARTQLLLFFAPEPNRVSVWSLPLYSDGRDLSVQHAPEKFEIALQARPAALFAMVGARLFVRDCVGAGPGCSAALYALPGSASANGNARLELPGNWYASSELEVGNPQSGPAGTPGQNTRSAYFVTGDGLSVFTVDLRRLRIVRRFSVERHLARPAWSARLAELRQAANFPPDSAGTLADFPEFVPPDAGNFARLHAAGDGTAAPGSARIEIYYGAGEAAYSVANTPAPERPPVLRLSLDPVRGELLDLSLVPPPEVR